MSIKSKIFAVSALSISLLIGGCAPKNPHPAQMPRYFSHTVQYQGENLSSIAKWYTGASTNWQAIQGANPDLKPNRLRMGTTVLIPSELVIRQDPFPRPKVTTVAKSSGEQTQPSNDGSSDSTVAETDSTTNVVGSNGSETTDTSTSDDFAINQNPDSVGDGEAAPSTDTTTTTATDTTTTYGSTGTVEQAPEMGTGDGTQVSQGDQGQTGGNVDGFLDVLGKAVIASKEEAKQNGAAPQ